MTCYVGEGELICERCAVDMTDDDIAIGGETDSPPHCSYCNRPLDDDFELTTEGVAYVLKTIRESLKAGTRYCVGRVGQWHEGSWYHGSAFHAVERDWVELWIEPWLYQFSKEERRLVELFMYWTRPEKMLPMGSPAYRREWNGATYENVPFTMPEAET